MTPLISLQKRYGLSPQAAKILRLLVEYKIVTPDMIRTEHKIAPEPKIAVYRLRNQMEQHGVNIESQQHVGYWLDEKTREQIAARVVEDLGPERDRPLDGGGHDMGERDVGERDVER